MSTPAVVIRLPLEGRPHVGLDVLTDSEQERLTDWLEAQAAYGELVARALQLEHEARAA